jgi:hypothetical protein
MQGIDDLPDELPDVETLTPGSPPQGSLSPPAEEPPTTMWPAPGERSSPQPPPPPAAAGPTPAAAGSRAAKPPRPARNGDFDAPAPPRRLSRAWAFGAALAVLVLAGEALYAFRGPLALRYPQMRPWLESACAQVDCSIPWPRDERLLKLEESELLEVPGKPGEISVGARVRNLASFAQEYPHIELTLTDASGQPAARRVLRPEDYFGRERHPGEVLAPGAEVTVQLRLGTPNLRPTGYQLLLFYP